MTRKIHTINAKNQSLGRIASRVSVLLQGKHKPTFAHEKDEESWVRIIHADQLKFTGKKREQKKYMRFSGYPGGIKVKTLNEMASTSPEKLISQAVYHMLPKNKKREKAIKRLIYLDIRK